MKIELRKYSDRVFVVNNYWINDCWWDDQLFGLLTSCGFVNLGKRPEDGKDVWEFGTPR